MIRLFFVFAIGILSGATDVSGCQQAVDAMKKEQWERAVSLSAECPTTHLAAQWKAFSIPNNVFSFKEISRFILQHHTTVDMFKIQIRAEESLSGSSTTKDILTYFSVLKPITGKGALFYVRALRSTGKGQEADQYVSQAWETLLMGSEDQATLYNENKNALREENHLARVDKLLWRERPAQAEKLLSLLSPPHQAWAKARIAYIRGDRDHEKLFSKVPDSIMKNPKYASGVWFDRIHWNRTKKTGKGEGLLSQVPLKAFAVNGDLWWKELSFLIREALQQKDYKRAQQILAFAHPEAVEAAYESHWLQGWLHLRFMNAPVKAIPHFKKMTEISKTNGSIAKGYYWLGRSYEALKNKPKSQENYRLGSKYFTSFYGQECSLKLKKPIHVQITPETKAQEISPTLKALKVLISSGSKGDAYTFSKTSLASLKNKTQAWDMLREVQEASPEGLHYITFEILKHWDIVNSVTYPTIKFPPDAKYHRALLLALIRRESHFDTKLVSPSGAMGLTQILKVTAKDMAERLKIAYEPEDLLENPQYNLTLGHERLRFLMERFEGNEVLTLASYNAGKQTVNRWVAAMGVPSQHPGSNERVDWIEKIPYQETRNYVQLVISNKRIYEALSKNR